MLNWPECEAGYVLPPTADTKNAQTVPATLFMCLQGVVLNYVQKHNYSYGRDFFKIGAGIARYSDSLRAGRLGDESR